MITRAALVGFGRFGGALGSLLGSAGIAFKAYDPDAPIPPRLRAASLAELVADAQVVVAAVPIPDLDVALRDLRPHLRSDHLVLDVASVKLLPQKLMSQWLGAEVPWVATHPLFGPTSLAIGERPLHVIVCPNREHPGAATRARELYKALDCDVIEQDAEAHDRCMARTHALAFFLAKGLLDIGVEPYLQEAPPSFRALARTIEAVRSDAGHLFATIHSANPYAEEARSALLQSLTQADLQLRRGEAPQIPEAQPESPQAKGVSPQAELERVRQRIDEVDGEVVGLLARRARLARAAGWAKEAAGRPIHDPKRESELLAARQRWAARAGLDATTVAEIFGAIMRFSRRAEGEPVSDQAKTEEPGGESPSK